MQDSELDNLLGIKPDPFATPPKPTGSPMLDWVPDLESLEKIQQTAWTSRAIEDATKSLKKRLGLGTYFPAPSKEEQSGGPLSPSSNDFA